MKVPLSSNWTSCDAQFYCLQLPQPKAVYFQLYPCLDLTTLGARQAIVSTLVEYRSLSTLCVSGAESSSNHYSPTRIAERYEFKSCMLAFRILLGLQGPSTWLEHGAHAYLSIYIWFAINFNLLIVLKSALGSEGIYLSSPTPTRLSSSRITSVTVQIGRAPQLP